MSQAVLVAMLAYIDDLQRSIDLNEKFADDVLALANEAHAGEADQRAHEAMLSLARRHRVDAIMGRAKMEAMTEQFVRRFGIERFEQERSKQSFRRRLA